MTGKVIPLRPTGKVTPLRSASRAPQTAPASTQPVGSTPAEVSLARTLYIAQRTLDDGTQGDELLAWAARRDLSAMKLIRHLAPAMDDSQVSAAARKLIAWLEPGPPRRSEHILTYARTLCLPHMEQR